MSGSRVGRLALLFAMVFSTIAFVQPTVASAAVGGIQGQITRGDQAAGNVKVDLFEAGPNGNRAKFLGHTRTNNQGHYRFNPADGCYVMTMIAPDGERFVSGSKWHQRTRCVNNGQSSSPLNAKLAGPACVPVGQPLWKAEFEDHFSSSGTPNNADWILYNSPGNAGYGLRRPSAITQSGGLLNIDAEIINGTLVSGGMKHRLSQKYGRYEFRVRTDEDPSEATSGVVLTWPTSGVHPRDGENNIYETLAKPGDRHEFYSFIHEPFGTKHDQVYVVHRANAAQWHTMVMEWAPDRLLLYRDGQLIRTIWENSDDLIPDNPHNLAIQLDAWKHTLGSPVRMQVDYVKVWSYDGVSPGC